MGEWMDPSVLGLGGTIIGSPSPRTDVLLLQGAEVASCSCRGSGTRGDFFFAFETWGKRAAKHCAFLA
jgi:hypothetical protein